MQKKRELKDVANPIATLGHATRRLNGILSAQTVRIRMTGIRVWESTIELNKI
jgi:hypothetical protein